MPNYRRLWVEGGTYFFTVVAKDRNPIFNDDSVRVLLRQGIQYTRQRHPFKIIAWVLLPDHLHVLWSLPPKDNDFAVRWMLIKSFVTKRYLKAPLNEKRNSLWQQRYWEHLIKSDDDLKRHLDYIHFNPVKHGLVNRAQDWLWSSFIPWVKRGEYQLDWTSEPEVLIGQEWD